MRHTCNKIISVGDVRRIVHTDIYSAKASEILEALRKFMLDKWGSSQMMRNAVLSFIDNEPNGEIVWKICKNANIYESGYYYSRTKWYERSTFASKETDQDVREWIACAIKHIVYDELSFRKLSQNENWKRDNDLKLECFKYKDNSNVTLAEVYCLYDKLLNRKSFNKHYSKAMIESIVGKEKDPILTELEITRREENKRLDEKYMNDKRDLELKRSDERNKAYAEINKKYDDLQNELLKAYNNSKIELEQSLSFMTNSELPSFLA